MSKGAITFSENNDWFTPDYIVAKFSPFDYDPATTGGGAKLMGIPNFDTIQTDGLKTDWTKYNKIWCNPPFTDKFAFLKKAVDAAKAGSEIYFLLPIGALTTNKFNKIVSCKYDLYLPNGRIRFVNPTGGSTVPAFGSVILHFHKNAKNKIIGMKI